MSANITVPFFVHYVMLEKGLSYAQDRPFLISLSYTLFFFPEILVSSYFSSHISATSDEWLTRMTHLPRFVRSRKISMTSLSRSAKGSLKFRGNILNYKIALDPYGIEGLVLKSNLSSFFIVNSCFSIVSQ